MRRLGGLLLALVLAVAALPATAEDRFIVMASTTSTANAGLLDDILPRFTEATGIGVRVVAVGTGQALRLAERGDADVLFVHDRPSEEKFVAAGYGVARHEVMYNDYVVVGPAEDPAGVADAPDVAEALRRIAAAGAAFVSRGDDSGTHKAEQRLWQAAGVDPSGASGGWYREVGAGMGATLNVAAGSAAYALADRGTWLSFRNRDPLGLLFQGDARLFNQYGVIVVNPARHAHAKAAEAQAFVDWVTGPAGQAAIAAFRIEGEPLFFPNASKTGS